MKKFLTCAFLVISIIFSGVLAPFTGLAAMASGTQTSGPLKTYADHDGKNHYADYKISMWMKTPEHTTYRLDLKFDNMGSQFLSSLQEMNPKDNRPKQPADGFAVILNIIDNSESFRYYFHENGMVFTKQYGKLYYLGSHPGKVSHFSMIFTFATLDNISKGQGGVSPLPAFDPWGDKELFTNTVQESQINQYLLTYSPNDYEVAIVPTSYGTQETPVLVKNILNKNKMLKILSESRTAVKRDKNTPPVMGSGTIIRVFNDKTVYNFVATGNRLQNYQVDNANIFFELPDDFYSVLNSTLQTELAERLRTP